MLVSARQGGRRLQRVGTSLVKECTTTRGWWVAARDGQYIMLSAQRGCRACSPCPPPAEPTGAVQGRYSALEEESTGSGARSYS